MAKNDKVALILMDYQDDPALVQRLEDSTYRARVERGVILTVEATDWNCPQHIVSRYNEAEIQVAIEPSLERLDELEKQLGREKYLKTGPK